MANLLLFIDSCGCYDKDAYLWSHVPWYKSVISLGSVSLRFTQPRGLALSMKIAKTPAPCDITTSGLHLEN